MCCSELFHTSPEDQITHLTAWTLNQYGARLAKIHIARDPGKQHLCDAWRAIQKEQGGQGKVDGGVSAVSIDFGAVMV